MAQIHMTAVKTEGYDRPWAFGPQPRTKPWPGLGGVMADPFWGPAIAVGVLGLGIVGAVWYLMPPERDRSRYWRHARGG